MYRATIHRRLAAVYSKLASEAKNTAGEIKETAEKAAETAKSEAESAAQNAADTAGGVVNEARSDAAEVFQSVKEKVEDAAGDIAKKADDMAGGVAESLPGKMKNSKSAVYIAAGIIAALFLFLIVALCSGGGPADNTRILLPFQKNEQQQEHDCSRGGKPRSRFHALRQETELHTGSALGQLNCRKSAESPDNASRFAVYCTAPAPGPCNRKIQIPSPAGFGGESPASHFNGSCMRRIYPHINAEKPAGSKASYGLFCLIYCIPPLT